LVSQNLGTSASFRLTGSSKAKIDAAVSSPTGAIEIVLGFLLIFRTVVPGLPFRLGDLAAFVLVVYALGKKPLNNSKYVSRFLFFSALMLAFLAAESFLNEVDFANRIMRISIHIGLAWAIATKRLSLEKLMQGFALGLIFNMAASLLNFAPKTNYAGTLTGFIMDKNVSGLYYAFFTATVPIWVKKNSNRFWLMAIGTIAVALSLSRTSIFALVIALIWMAVARNAGIFTKATFATIFFYFYNFADSRLSYLWVFSERVGSDELRARIDEATIAKAAETPWFGQGLGTANVVLDTYFFQFHNSYYALFVEGGWVLVLVFLVGAGLLVLHPFKSPPFTAAEVAVQAAGIVVLICATRLGEVFITIPSFVLLGIAMTIAGRSKAQVS